MAIDTVGYYTLPVIPSLRGAEKAINSQLQHALGDVGTIGKHTGEQLGEGIASGLASAESKTRTAADRHAKAVNRMADASGNARVAIQQLNEAIASGASGSKLEQASEKVAKALRNEAEAARQTKRAENDLGNAKRGQEAAAAADKIAKSLQKEAEAARQAEHAESNLGSAFHDRLDLAATSSKVADALRKEAEAARQAQRAESGLGGVRRPTTVAASNPMGGVAAGMRDSEGGLSSIAGDLGTKVGGAFTKGLALVAGAGAIAKFFKESISTGLDLERSVNAFSGVTAQAGESAEATAARMGKMREVAKALGSDTNLAGVTARDAANAMLELAKGGMTAEQAMAAARGTLQLATAGQLDAAQAAAIQSAAINTFSLKATDAAHVADLLAAAANASSADVSDLGIALRQGGSVAAGFGVSIEDTLTALTMFSRMGINGSDAGTMLKTSLQAITDQGNPAQGAIEALGLTLYDAKGNFVGLESMMKQVAEASKRMTPEMFQANTAILFGSDAMRASMVAAKGGAEAWDDAAAAVRRQGAAADMANAQMKGLPGVVEALSNTWEGFKLRLFDVLDGPLISIGHWFTDVLSGNGPQWLKDLASQFVSVGSTIGEHVLPALKDAWTQLKGPLMDMGKQWMASLKEAMPIIKVVAALIGGALLGALKFFTAEATGFIRALTFVQHVAQMVFQGIKGGVGVFTEVASVIKGVGVGAWDTLKGAISAAWQVISPVWDGIKTGLAALGEAGRYVFDTVLLPMWHNFQTAAGAAAAVLSPIWDGIKTGFTAIGDAANWLWNNAIVPAWDGITGAISGAWNFIQPVFEQLKNGFKATASFISTVFNGISGAVKSALDAVINAVKGPLRWLGGVLQKVPTSIGPIEIPGARAAIDLGTTLAGLAGGGVAGRTRAGTLWGPGTGTSDSILGVDAGGRPTAFVSAGEGVVKVDAMRKGGNVVVSALNAGWTPSADYLHGMVPGLRGGGVAGSLNTQGAQVDTIAIARAVQQRFGVNDIGMYRSPDGFNEHSSGEAADVMVGSDTKLGDAVKDFVLKFAKDFGIQYAIWQQKMWYPDGRVEGMADRGSPTQNHMDHVHVRTEGGGYPAGGGPGSAGAGRAPTSTKPAPAAQAGYTLPDGGGSYGGAGGRGGPAGSTFLGYGAPDPRTVREAQERVSDADQRITEADARVSEAETRLGELGPKAKASQRQAAEDHLAKAKAQAEKARREKADAEQDLAEAQQGKAQYGKAGQGGQGQGQGGPGDPSQLGSIFSQFLKDTFGLGSILPDPSQLGIFQIANALLGIRPAGGGAGGAGGGLGGLVDSAGQAVGGSGGSGLPFGMIPGVSSVLPALDQPAAAAAGYQGGPTSIDQSTHLTVENPQLTEGSNAALIRRTLLNTPRLGTYTPPGVTT